MIKRALVLKLCFFLTSAFASEKVVSISHDQIQQYSMHGNFQKAVCSKEMGAKQFEIWKASIAVGSKTPKHVHDSEEVFILLKGSLRAIIGDQEIECIAPATLICPANIPHQLINIGDVPSEQILVLGIGSHIYDESGRLMKLPWRSD